MMGSHFGDAPMRLPAPLRRWVRAAVWLLPVWGVFLAVSTVTHQPDYDTDFAGYADYVTTVWFLTSHLLFSIVGAALAVVAAVALGVGLSWTAAAGSALWGMALFGAAQVVTTSVFGIAAFFQPAVGRLFQDGDEAAARSINDDVYGPEVVTIVAVGVVLMIVGAILLGRAAARSTVAPAWAAWLFAASVPVFAVAGFTIEILQPIAGVAVAVSGFALARSISAAMAETVAVEKATTTRRSP